jgi:pyrroloquinoline quinone (PQQ) biosynthesis protein C
LKYCNRAELQREAVRALEFKCDVLWSMLDAIHHAYFKEGRSLVHSPANNLRDREIAAPD